jgi:MATE family multidrug resistance protein
MALSVGDLRKEIRPMLRLAAPLAVAELGWMAMGLVDTIMAGPLGPAAVGAGILGNMVYYPIVTSGVGILLGMDTLVSQSFGANRPEDCRRILVSGIWLALMLTAPLALLTLAAIPLMRAAGAVPEVMAQCTPYMHALIWGIPPLLAFSALRRYLQAVNLVKPVTLALVSASATNFLGNWVLMYGHWGFRPLGLAGSGWSTTISRVYMAALLLGAVIWHERKDRNARFRISWLPDLHRMRKLVFLGLPAAGQIVFEGAVFSVVTVLAAKLDAISLAAHGIAVQVITTTYMVPLGISSAAAVRVGQAIGRRDALGAAASGWAALLLGAGFMGAAGVALWAAPERIVRIFIRDSAVAGAGALLLRIAAFFELFDGIQTVATGALRGLGDTRSPMLAHLIFYWLIGMPVAWLLCFYCGWGAPGIWVGLSIALILIGASLLVVWRQRQKDQSTLV